MPESAKHNEIRYRVNESVAYREIEGQTLLLLPDQYELYTLNATGQVVWRTLVEGETASIAVARLARRFGISLEQALRDVGLLIQELEAKNILRRE